MMTTTMMTTVITTTTTDSDDNNDNNTNYPHHHYHHHRCLPITKNESPSAAYESEEVVFAQHIVTDGLHRLQSSPHALVAPVPGDHVGPHAWVRWHHGNASGYHQHRRLSHVGGDVTGA